MSSTNSVRHCPHIAIIESPGMSDFRAGRVEGKSLSGMLTLAGVEHRYFLVNDTVSLDRCIDQVAVESQTTMDNNVPLFRMLYIHLSMHGNEEGVQLTDGQFIPWRGLAERLLRLAEQGDRIFPDLPDACMQSVCLSTCCGFHGNKMAEGQTRSPYFGLVGPRRQVKWSDSLTAFVAFYNAACTDGLYGTPGNVLEGVKRMNAAIGQAGLFDVCQAGGA